MDSKPALSDYLARLPSSPEVFPFFYRRLIGLRFPIPVAEILELRFLSHQAIDRAQSLEPTLRWNAFAAQRTADMEAAGVHKSAHRQRLLHLLQMIRAYHEAHAAASLSAEEHLRVDIDRNRAAQDQSLRYGKIAGSLTLVAGVSAFLLSPPAVIMEGLTVLLAYFTVDSFYSRSLLKREERLLRQELTLVLRHRVRTVNWKAVVRQAGAILGYRQPRCGEAFRVEPGPEQELLELDEA